MIAIRKAEWDPNDHVPRIVEAMVSYFDQDVIEYRGTLEYLGSDVSREKALDVFTKIIADYQRGDNLGTRA